LTVYASTQDADCGKPIMKAAIFAQLRDKIAALEKSYAGKGVEGRFDHPVWVWRELQRLVIRA